MHHFFEAITNTAGDSLIGYFARVINRTTQNTVTLSSDENGTPIVVVSGVENMAKSDDYGNLSLYVDPGTYHLDIYAPNTTTFLYRVSDVAMNSTKGDAGAPGTPGADGEDGATGETGPANSTYTTLAAMKAAGTTNKTYNLAAPSGTDSGFVNGPFIYQTGNFTGRTDVVQLNGVPLTTGALVRQQASGIGFVIGKSAQQKMSEEFSLDDIRLGNYSDDNGRLLEAQEDGRRKIKLLTAKGSGNGGEWVIRQSPWVDPAAAVLVESPGNLYDGLELYGEGPQTVVFQSDGNYILAHLCRALTILRRTRNSISAT
jgi:hypothetical protein